MQRLEVSCAVRRIYTSLGAKGLRNSTTFTPAVVYQRTTRSSFSNHTNILQSQGNTVYVFNLTGFLQFRSLDAILLP